MPQAFLTFMTQLMRSQQKPIVITVALLFLVLFL